MDERSRIQVAHQLRPLAEECQLAMDLWLADGRKAATGLCRADDVEQTRRRMEKAIAAYREALEAALARRGAARPEPALT